ncbi:hypothetical protein C0J52_28342, partial [Blattella germanica]
LRWAGHIIRIEEDNPARKFTLLKPEGSRRVGRPKLRRMDGIEEDLRTIGTRAWKRLALDRDDWRKVSAAAWPKQGCRAMMMMMCLMFVDFQVCQWTSPASDLLSFINSNAAIEVLENQNALIDEYYTTLCQTLTILGHGDLSPTKCHLYEQIEKRHKSGVISSIVIRAAVLADKDAKPNLEKVLKGEEESGSGFSEKFKFHIRSVLSIFHKKGWL